MLLTFDLRGYGENFIAVRHSFYLQQFRVSLA